MTLLWSLQLAGGAGTTEHLLYCRGGLAFGALGLPSPTGPLPSAFCSSAEGRKADCTLWCARSRWRATRLACAFLSRRLLHSLRRMRARRVAQNSARRAARISDRASRGAASTGAILGIGAAQMVRAHPGDRMGARNILVLEVSGGLKESGGATHQSPDTSQELAAGSKKLLLLLRSRFFGSRFRGFLRGGFLSFFSHGHSKSP